MRRYISIVSVRQVDFNIYLLWDCGRFLTASDCRRLFCVDSRPVGRRSVRTTRSGGPCGFLLDVLVAVDLRGLLGVLRCIVVPVVGSHSICAGLTRSKETVSTLPLTRIFITLPLLATPYMVRRKGRQRRCNCDSAQEYMSTCSYFLELENVVLLCVTWRT